MPTSITEGKKWMFSRILQHLPGRVLDVGVGVGTYAMYLAYTRPESRWCGIEIHEPYVEMYDLQSKYDFIIVGDARKVKFPQADVVILGDVLEHMTMLEARALLIKSRYAANRIVVASIPIGKWPQGAVHGNEHERHVETYTHKQVMSNFPEVHEFARRRRLAVYSWKPL